MIAKLLGFRKEAEAPPAIDWYVDLFQNPPTIKTDRLVLRGLELKDARGLYEIDSDEEICQLALSDLLTYPQQAIDLIQHYRTNGMRGYPAPLAVALKENDSFIGTCGVTHLDVRTLTIRLGFAYIRSAWNQGFGTEALQAIVQHLMQNTEVFRLECHCFPGNKASRRIMEKAGMSYEGILRQAEVSSHGRHDCCVYSILRPEWEAGEKLVSANQT